MTTWADVVEGDTVVGKNDSLWLVEAKTPLGEVTTTNIATGKRNVGVPPPNKEVTVVLSAAARAEATEALVRVTLGGLPVARQDEQGRWTCPVGYVHLGSLLAHLHTLHGLDLALATQAYETIGMAEQVHHQLHTEGNLFVPHVHDPDFLKGS